MYRHCRTVLITHASRRVSAHFTRPLWFPKTQPPANQPRTIKKTTNTASKQSGKNGHRIPRKSLHPPQTDPARESKHLQSALHRALLLPTSCRWCLPQQSICAPSAMPPHHSHHRVHWRVHGRLGPRLARRGAVRAQAGAADGRGGGV